MVTVFNRQLLISTYATEEQARIRDMLRAAAIPYLVRTSDATLRFSEPDRRGSVLSARNSSLSTSCEYRIYVKRKDYEAAAALIGRGPLL